MSKQGIFVFCRKTIELRIDGRPKFVARWMRCVRKQKWLLSSDSADANQYAVTFEFVSLSVFHLPNKDKNKKSIRNRLEFGKINLKSTISMQTNSRNGSA